MGNHKKSTALAQIDAVLKKKKGPKQKGGGARKIGRYAKHASSQRYKAERRWEKNKLRRIARHLKRYPDDHQAARLLAEAKAA